MDKKEAGSIQTNWHSYSYSNPSTIWWLEQKNALTDRQVFTVTLFYINIVPDIIVSSSISCPLQATGKPVRSWQSCTVQVTSFAPKERPVTVLVQSTISRDGNELSDAPCIGTSNHDTESSSHRTKETETWAALWGSLDCALPWRPGILLSVRGPVWRPHNNCYSRKDVIITSHKWHLRLQYWIEMNSDVPIFPPKPGVLIWVTFLFYTWCLIFGSNLIVISSCAFCLWVFIQPGSAGSQASLSIYFIFILRSLFFFSPPFPRPTTTRGTTTCYQWGKTGWIGSRPTNEKNY